MKAKGNSWREVIPAVASERATQESLRLWAQEVGKRPPFNYRLEHLKVVVRIAQALAERLGADQEVVWAAAWLHDLAKEEDHWPEGDDHGPAGAREARRILEGTDFPLEKVEAVCQAIAKHAGLYRDAPLEPLEAAILWDADKLAKLGALSIAQFLCLSPSFEKPLTAESILSQIRGWLQLAEGIVASMNTPLGKEMARKRHHAMREFVSHLEEEIDEATPGRFGERPGPFQR